VVGLFIRILTRAEVNWQEGKSSLFIFYVLFDLSSGVTDGLVCKISIWGTVLYIPETLETFLTVFNFWYGSYTRKRLVSGLNLHRTENWIRIPRPNSWTKSWHKSQDFSSLLFKVTYTALPWHFYFFKLTQPLTVSTVQLLYTVKEKGGKPDRKTIPLPCGLSPYRNFKSENSQDYAQKTSTKLLYVHEFGIRLQVKMCLYLTQQLRLTSLLTIGKMGEPM
jgi:hypothetical protein